MKKENYLRKQIDEMNASDDWKEKITVNKVSGDDEREMYIVDTPFVDSLYDNIQLWIDRSSGDVICDDGYTVFNLLNITGSNGKSRNAVRKYAEKHGIDFNQAGKDVLSIPIEFGKRTDIERAAEKLVLAQLELEDRFVE